MQKQLLTGLFMVLFHSGAYALNPYGFSIGGDATVTRWEVKTQTEFHSSQHQDLNESFNNHEYDYSGLLRVGWYLNWGNDRQWLTALNILAEPHAVTFDHLMTNALFSSSINYSLGGELKQGFFFSPNVLGFVTVGLMYTQYEFLAAFQTEHVVSNTEKFTLPGFRFGGGVEVFVLENLGLNLLLNYTAYEDKTLEYQDQNTDFDPEALQMGLGLNIYF